MISEWTVTSVLLIEPTPLRIERGIIAEVGVCLGGEHALAYRLEFDDNLDLHLEPKGARDHRLLTARARVLAMEHHDAIEAAVIDALNREVGKRIDQIACDLGQRPPQTEARKGSVN